MYWFITRRNEPSPLAIERSTSNSGNLTYRRKDVIEKGFDDLKNHIDMKRLRTHNTNTTDGKLFCAFVALIAVSHINAKLGEFMTDKSMSKDSVIAELEKIKAISASADKRLMNPLTKTQRSILEAFKLSEDDVKAYITRG